MTSEFIKQYGEDPLAGDKVFLLKTLCLDLGLGGKFAALEAQLEEQIRAPQALRDSITEYLGGFRTTTQRAVGVVWETAERRGLDLHRDPRTKGVATDQVYKERPFLRRVVGLVSKSPYAEFDMLALPEGYRNASFEDFEILCDGHNVALRLLQRFGINPPKGLFFWGNYGTGKTHLVSAYALSIKELLELGYLGGVAQFTEATISEGGKKYKEFNTAAQALKNRLQFIQNSQVVYQQEYGQLDAATDQYLAVYVEQQFGEIVGRSPYKPSDLAFITFDDLFDRRDDDKFIETLLSRRIVIIDDIHPKGERARMNLIQRIIERRYNEARSGATFITSNIAPEQLLSAEGYPKEVGERVHSRLQEMCLPIEFTAEDYRVTKAKRQNAEILALLEEQES